MNDLIFFLPGIIALGIITSYEDFKTGKIRNKWVVSGLIYALIANIALVGYYSLVSIVRWEYVAELIVNFLISVVVGFAMWNGKLWTPGDAKLFIAFSALVPLSVYSYGYVKWFPSITILLNTFIPVFVVFCFIVFFKTSVDQKKEAVVSLIKPRNVLEMMFSLFAIYWIIQLLFKFIGMPQEYIINMVGTVVFYYILQKTFGKKVFFVSLIVASARLLFDESVYNLAFLENLIGVYISWFVFKGAISNLGDIAFSKEKRIKDIKVGDILAENVYNKDGVIYKYEQIKSREINGAMASGYNEIIDEENVGRIKEQLKKKKIMSDTVKIKETLPFGPFMLFGVLITIIAKGNILIWVMFLFS